MSFRSSIRTVEVQGVVATSGGGGGTTPAPTITRSAANSYGDGGGTARTQPAEVGTKTGDLMVAICWHFPAGGSVSTPPGWTQVSSTGNTNTNIRCTTMTKVADATDAAQGRNYTWTFSSQYWSIMQLSYTGATAFAQGPQLYDLAVNAAGTLATPSCSTGQVIVATAGSPTSPRGNILAWTGSAAGGPPATQPTLTNFLGTPAAGVCSIGWQATANWSPAASYSMQPTNDRGGAQDWATFLLS